MNTQADATTSDAIASPEALDAAAAAATTGAGAPPPAPAPSSEPAAPPVGGSEDGAPSVQDYVDDEGLDLSSSGLPEATQEEIKKLRREVRGVKDVARSWQQATEGWHESDIELLRTALVQGRTNPDAVGQWMIDQAKTLLGDRYAELTGAAPAEPEPKVGDPDGEGGALTAADVERLVNERLEAERHEQRITAQVETLKRQTEDLGFGPTHPLHYALLSIAKTQTNGNLAAAAEQLRSGLATVDPNTADDSQPGAGGQSQPGAGHTPAAPNGGTPAGTQRPESPRAAAEERLSKVLGNARGFNDLQR